MEDIEVNARTITFPSSEGAVLLEWDSVSGLAYGRAEIRFNLNLKRVQVKPLWLRVRPSVRSSNWVEYSEPWFFSLDSLRKIVEAFLNLTHQIVINQDITQ